MTTGRKLIESALRGPMQKQGWSPRAAGWFTRTLSAGTSGVLAIGVASKHSAPGTATATLHVHLRDEQLEADVAELTGVRDQGYKTTTATTSIGYLLPAARWFEWDVHPTNADAVAAEMVAAAHTYAEPHLRALAADPRALLAAIASSPSYTDATGFARVVVLMRRTGLESEASQLFERRMAGLAGRTDVAAEMERRLIAVLGDSR